LNSLCNITGRKYHFRRLPLRPTPAAAKSVIDSERTRLQEFSALRWYTSALFCLSTALTVAACAKDPVSPGGGNTALVAPTIDAPTDDEQLNTLRPTIVVRNSTSNSSANRTYEFQLATSDTFTSIALTRAGIPEGGGGRTSFTPDADLQSTTRYFWRARITQGSSTSDWSPIGRFRTRVVGYNNPGELFDPLTNGETLGTVFGPTEWVAGKGLKLLSGSSFVRYQLPRTISSGEFSMLIEGIAPNGPGGKPRLFSMSDRTGLLTDSKFEMNVQYRGRPGNPDNCIAFKAIWGDDDVALEPALHERQASIRILDPARTYFWQATWTPLIFRLVVREDGPAGNVIFDMSKTSPSGYGPYAPSPHYAYLGANELQFGGEDGTSPGVTIRNVWLSDRSRPATLGSAVSDR
jgi:hypothetical protein